MSKASEKKARAEAITAQLTTIAALPLFSARVYHTALDMMYAEPHFSDVQCDDIAKSLTGELETGITAFQVMGAMKRLVDAGLCEWDNTDVNGAERNFIQVVAHNIEIHAEALKVAAERIHTLSQTPKALREKAAKDAWKVKVEPATEHLRNALQTLAALEPFDGLTAGEALAEEIQSVKARIEQALIALAAGNVGK